MLYNATDNLSFTLAGSYSQLDAPEYKSWRTLGTNYFATPGAIIAYDPFTTSEDLAPKNRVKDSMVNLTSSLDLGFANLVSYTAFFTEAAHEDVDLDGSSAAVINLMSDYGQHTFTQEVNLISQGSNRFTWVVGAYYFNDYSFLNYQSTNGVVTNKTKVWTDSYSIFADATWNFMGNFFLTGGPALHIRKEAPHLRPRSALYYRSGSLEKPDAPRHSAI